MGVAQREEFRPRVYRQDGRGSPGRREALRKTGEGRRGSGGAGLRAREPAKDAAPPRAGARSEALAQRKALSDRAQSSKFILRARGRSCGLVALRNWLDGLPLV